MLNLIYRKPRAFGNSLTESSSLKDGVSNNIPSDSRPITNKGLSARVDYFRGKMSFDSNLELMDAVDYILNFAFEPGGEYFPHEEGLFRLAPKDKSYKYQITGVTGARILYNYLDLESTPSPEDEDDYNPFLESCAHKKLDPEFFPESPKKKKPKASLAVQFSGQFFEDLDIVSSFNFLRYFNKYNIRVTRLDLAITDFSIPLSDEFLFDVLVNRNYSGFKTHKTVSSYDRKLDRTFTTFYFGARESESFCRIYNTLPKHKYEAQRVELEYKGRKSRAVYKLLCDTPDEIEIAKWYSQNDGIGKSFSTIALGIDELEMGCYYQSQIVSIIFGSISLIDRSLGDKNLSRCPKLPEWKSFVERCYCTKPIKIVVPKTVSVGEKNEKWLLKQASKSLFFRYLTLGKDNFLEWLENLFVARDFPLDIESVEDATYKAFVQTLDATEYYLLKFCSQLNVSCVASKLAIR
jgi:hypothetical protein